MDQDSSDCGSETGEGFEAQKISIEKKKQQEQLLYVNSEEGNDLVDDLRPKDFLPRSVFKQISLSSYQPGLDVIQNFNEESKLVAMAPDSPGKCKRHASLEQKYKNSGYELVYSKFGNQNSDNYLHSYFNLEAVIDYSPLNFTTFGSGSPSSSLFDSNFQCGNLLYAYKVNANEYDLVLQNDTNTKGYNQWFYFSYQFESASCTTFNIVSMIKKKTLFEKGVKPSFFVQDAENRWRQVTSEVKYFKNGVQRENGEAYYTLSFKYNPQNACKVFFSLNLPYSYTKMTHFVKELEALRGENIIIQRKTLCYSLSNNAIPYLIFRSPIHKTQRQILFFARQHPGQTISSHIMQSLLRSLCAKHRLLEKFQIICVPMLNVDGVIYGNFRTNLAGFDINRQWQHTDKWLTPEVHAMKKLIVRNPNIEFVLDLHGHSKKFNSFIYACKQESKFNEKLFPFLMSRNSLFKIQSCTYGLTKDKLTTARAFIRGRGINHVYTLETSFYGYGTENDYYRFQSKHFYSLGETIILSLQQLYFSKTQELLKHEDAIQRIIQRQDRQLQVIEIDSGSDSNPSQDELSDDERDKHVIPQKVLAQIKEKQIKTRKQKAKKQHKSVRIADTKQKRNSSTQISKRQFHSSQKYQFRKTFQSFTRPYNRTAKTVVNKTIEQRSYRTSIKLTKQTEKVQPEKKTQNIVITKKKPKVANIKPIQPVKQEKKPEKSQKPNVSNLFLSNVQRSSVKTKRTHKSLLEDKQLGQIQRNNRSFLNIDKQKLRAQERELQKQRQREERERQKESLSVTSNHKQENQINSMMADMKNNLKELSKLDKIVEQRIRQKMSHNLISNVPKSRQSHINTNAAGFQQQSNLLEFRSIMGSTILMEQSKYQSRNQSKSKKARSHKGKKQLIFLSELMRPKVEQNRNYNIQIIGNSSDNSSIKNKQMYFNQFL